MQQRIFYIDIELFYKFSRHDGEYEQRVCKKNMYDLYRNAVNICTPIFLVMMKGIHHKRQIHVQSEFFSKRLQIEINNNRRL